VPGPLVGWVARTLPANGQQDLPPSPSPPSETTTQDIVDDWEGQTYGDGSKQSSGWFKNDGVFTAALIVGLTVVSTLVFQVGFRRIHISLKHARTARGLRQRVKVDAPVVPRNETAEQYPTGWPDTEEDGAWSVDTIERGSENRLPLRTPQGEDARKSFVSNQKEKYEDFKNRVDRIGSVSGQREGGELGDEDDEYGGRWDGFYSDDEAPHASMSFAEMKDRAKKANSLAARAAAHAHQASIAASIASEACNEAAAAANRALEASFRTDRALERSSGQHIMNIYNEARKAEAVAEERARLAAEMSAKSLIDEYKAGKAGKKAVQMADASRPHGVVNIIRAWWFVINSAAKRAGELGVQGYETVSCWSKAAVCNLKNLFKRLIAVSMEAKNRAILTANNLRASPRDV
jgi:hypothetical protein